MRKHANNSDTDQPAHPHSLISAFVVHSLDSIILVDSISKISRLQLAPVGEQTCLSIAWSGASKDRFSQDMAHLSQLMRYGTFRHP